MDPLQFSKVISGVAVVAAVGAIVVPLVVPATSAFVGAVVTSALVALAFAGYNAYSVATYGRPRFAAAAVAAVFGLWLVAAPLVYDVGAVAIAGTQLTGMVLASTAGYATLDAIERALLGTEPPPETAAGGDYRSTHTTDDD